jgi:hypothetical protein
VRHKAWEKCERSQFLSFHHHTLAARSDNPATTARTCRLLLPRLREAALYVFKVRYLSGGLFLTPQPLRV